MSDREEAVTSLNKAWDVLGSQGIVEALVNVGISKAAGCGEYCGSYDGCTGYCKPMGKRILGQEVINPAEVATKTQRGEVAAEIRVPFSS